MQILDSVVYRLSVSNYYWMLHLTSLLKVGNVVETKFQAIRAEQLVANLDKLAHAKVSQPFWRDRLNAVHGPDLAASTLMKLHYEYVDNLEWLQIELREIEHVKHVLESVRHIQGSIESLSMNSNANSFISIWSKNESNMRSAISFFKGPKWIGPKSGELTIWKALDEIWERAAAILDGLNNVENDQDLVDFLRPIIADFMMGITSARVGNLTRVVESADQVVGAVSRFSSNGRLIHSPAVANVLALATLISQWLFPSMPTSLSPETLDALNAPAKVEVTVVKIVPEPLQLPAGQEALPPATSELSEKASED